MNKKIYKALAPIMIASAISGCGAAEKNPSQTAKVEEPVKLKMFLTQTFTDQEFQEMLVEPLQKKYPYITLEKMTQTKIEDVLASGDLPDLITIWNGQILPYERMGLLEDITPLLTQNKVDLNRFEPGSLDAIRIGQNKNHLYGLPYATQFNALYYNKDLFDKFGVGYPGDGMFWEDAIELAKKVSRVDGGVQYRGLDYETVIRIAFPLSINYIDPITQKPNVNSDSWRKAFQLGKDIISIPNNMPAKIDADGTKLFFETKTIAMYGSINYFQNLKKYMDGGLNVGVAQYPSYKHQPNVYGLVDAHYMLVGKQSKHKDAAVKVLEVLTSDEVQALAAGKYARLSPLKNPEFKQKFASEMPHLKGLSIQSIFKSKPAPGPIFPTLYSPARSIVQEQYMNFATDKQDLNTALKVAEEKINQLIESEKSK